MAGAKTEANLVEREFMRVVFVGSSSFGFRCLKQCFKLPDCEIIGVVTNPRTFSISYRPDGVTNVLYEDLRPLAEERGIPVFLMTAKMSDKEVVETFRKWRPDLILVVGWYHMVPREIRAIAPAIGLHSSLLPDYSGGAPLVWAIIKGEDKTGITLFFLEDGVDNGDIIDQKEEPILPDDTIATLYRRIEKAGLELLRTNLPRIAKGHFERTRQDESRRRIMPQRGPEDGRINWNWSAQQIYNFVRAQTKPYPGAFTLYNGQRVIVWECKVCDYVYDGTTSTSPGQVMDVVNDGPRKGIVVATGEKKVFMMITKIGVEAKANIDIIYYARQSSIEPGVYFN